MKGIIIISFLLLLCLTDAKLSIQNQQQVVLAQGQDIELTCNNAQGQVHFQVASLPAGVALNGNTLTIVDASQATSGYYPIQIRAQDSVGQFDQRIIVIIITNTSQSEIITQTTQTTNQASTSQTSSSVSSSLQVDQGVNDLLNTLDISNQFVATDYSSGYPTLQLPTGSSSNIINPAPVLIANEQAAPSASNRNQITAQDVRSHGTFERQLNAAKALANLLSIIKQATANRNVAQQQVADRTDALNEAISKQQEAALAVQDADRNYKRAQAGVASLNEQATNLRNTIASLQVQLQEKKMQRESTQAGIKRAEDTLAQVNTDLNIARNHLAQTAARLADKEVQCNGLEDQLAKAQDDLNQRPEERQRLENSLQAAQDKVDADTDLVNTLIQRLNEAQAALEASKGEVDRLSQNLADFVAETARIQARVNDLATRFAECQEQYGQIESELNRIKDQIIPALQENAFDIQNEIDALESQLANLNNDIAEIPQKIADANAELQNVLERLQYLRGQVLILQKILRQAFLQGNTAANAVATARQNLDAAIARLQKEQEIIDSATLNLERARIEKEEADLAVENLLKEGADILPFAAAPSVTGVIEGEGNYQIAGWNSFVSQAFGASVKPLFTGDLQTLYPWKFDAAESNLRQDEGNCPQSGLTSLSGYIINSSNNSINMIDSNSGSVYTVQISGCTLNLSNQQNYSVQAGDIIVVKGSMQNNVVNASQTACIRR